MFTHYVEKKLLHFISYNKCINTNYINNKAYAEQDAAAVKLSGMLSLNWYQLS